MYRNWRNLIRPKKLEFSEKELSATYGKFVASPLERGFGITLGNGLRRVLLSSLQGAAVTKVRFDNVLHEFTTIPGVVEDVTDILLNFKELKLKLSNVTEETLYLDIKGPKTIKASDIQCSANVQILNPNLHIATLNGNTPFKAEMTVKMGRGYVTAELNKSANDPVSVIPVDAIFSPVTRVNYTVTNARVGQRTDYDKLALEIWTNGAVKPDDALAYAAKILKEQLQIFINFEELPEPAYEEEKPVIEESPKLNPNLYRRVDELELSVRSANCLANANIHYIGELVQRSEGEMLKTKNFGRKSLNEIKEILTEMNLTLGMKLDGYDPKDADKFRPKDVE